MARKPNLLLIGIDSLRGDYMSLYGHRFLTTPHMDRFARTGTAFENAFCAHVPTTSGYGSMLSGHDCFGTNTVALRHRGPMADGIPTLAEVLGEAGYVTTSVGFRGNPAARGFQNYIDFKGWGSLAEGRSPKAENLNEVALPELKRLAGQEQPFFLFLRHMDPHSPYLPPKPFERMFYAGEELDPSNHSMDPVFTFKPFCDYFATWMPPGLTDKDYVIAQYDGAVAYMDACIQSIFESVTRLGLDENTLVVITADHGETLYDHDCYFDHHGIYDCTLRVPLIFRLPGKVPAGLRLGGNTTHPNTMPTILDILHVPTAKLAFSGHSLYPEMKGARRTPDTEFYITECTWMRKHGWRTPEWKLIHALEPDFHFKPEIELYNLVDDPEENVNLADKEPEVVKLLEARMQAWIAQREKATGRPNPMYTNLQWHGIATVPGPFTSSQQAYDSLHIGDPEAARKLQAQAFANKK